MTRPMDVGAAGSSILAGWASVAHVNEILQLLAYVVAIASGAPTIYHYVSAWLAKRKGKKDGN